MFKALSARSDRTEISTPKHKRYEKRYDFCRKAMRRDKVLDKHRIFQDRCDRVSEVCVTFCNRCNSFDEMMCE